jgi:uncharacterized protein YdhG (YjbR/CyaY superfamily)
MADKAQGFSAEEKAAMKERIREAKAAAANADGEAEVRAKIAGMAAADRAMAERIHATMRSEFPDLVPRTYYGMPAYAKDGKAVCWFKDAGKFKSRYASFEFADVAALDDGEMWPVSFAVTRLTDDAMARIVALVKRAVG